MLAASALHACMSRSYTGYEALTQEIIANWTSINAALGGTSSTDMKISNTVTLAQFTTLRKRVLDGRPSRAGQMERSLVRLRLRPAAPLPGHKDARDRCRLAERRRAASPVGSHLPGAQEGRPLPRFRPHQALRSAAAEYVTGCLRTRGSAYGK